MSIHYAILGILSERPLTGYDVKKIMQDSPFLYWSGNNNQVYKALLELNDRGYVTSEVHHQDGAPSRKVYTITQAGLAELREGARARPELPETKKPFLIQLAWTWQLRTAEVETLLTQYEEEVKARLLLEQGRLDAARLSPARTPRKSAIWPLLYENVADGYRQELAWIERVRATLAEYAEDDTQEDDTQEATQDIKGENAMHYTLMEKGTNTYLLIDAAGRQIQTEQDGLDLIALCAQHGTNLLLIQGDALSDDFFRLRTGLAGAIAQKFAQYSIKAAIVLDESRGKGKFKDFETESNRGTMLHTYAHLADAEHWLLGM